MESLVMTTKSTLQRLIEPSTSLVERFRLIVCAASLIFLGIIAFIFGINRKKCRKIGKDLKDTQEKSSSNADQNAQIEEERELISSPVSAFSSLSSSSSSSSTSSNLRRRCLSSPHSFPQRLSATGKDSLGPDPERDRDKDKAERGGGEMNKELGENPTEEDMIQLISELIPVIEKTTRLSSSLTPSRPKKGEPRSAEKKLQASPQNEAESQESSNSERQEELRRIQENLVSHLSQLMKALSPEMTEEKQQQGNQNEEEKVGLPVGDKTVSQADSLLQSTQQLLSLSSPPPYSKNNNDEHASDREESPVLSYSSSSCSSPPARHKKREERPRGRRHSVPEKKSIYIEGTSGKKVCKRNKEEEEDERDTTVCSSSSSIESSPPHSPTAAAVQSLQSFPSQEVEGGMRFIFHRSASMPLSPRISSLSSSLSRDTADPISCHLIEEYLREESIERKQREESMSRDKNDLETPLEDFKTPDFEYLLRDREVDIDGNQGPEERALIPSTIALDKVNKPPHSNEEEEERFTLEDQLLRLSLPSSPSIFGEEREGNEERRRRSELKRTLAVDALGWDYRVLSTLSTPLSTSRSLSSAGFDDREPEDGDGLEEDDAQREAERESISAIVSDREREDSIQRLLDISAALIEDKPKEEVKQQHVEQVKAIDQSEEVGGEEDLQALELYRLSLCNTCEKMEEDLSLRISCEIAHIQQMEKDLQDILSLSPALSSTSEDIQPPLARLSLSALSRSSSHDNSNSSTSKRRRKRHSWTSREQVASLASALRRRRARMNGEEEVDASQYPAVALSFTENNVESERSSHRPSERGPSQPPSVRKSFLVTSSSSSDGEFDSSSSEGFLSNRPKAYGADTTEEGMEGAKRRLLPSANFGNFTSRPRQRPSSSAHRSLSLTSLPHYLESERRKELQLRSLSEDSSIKYPFTYRTRDREGEYLTISPIPPTHNYALSPAPFSRSKKSRSRSFQHPSFGAAVLSPTQTDRRSSLLPQRFPKVPHASFPGVVSNS